MQVYQLARFITVVYSYSASVEFYKSSLGFIAVLQGIVEFKQGFYRRVTRPPEGIVRCKKDKELNAYERRAGGYRVRAQGVYGSGWRSASGAWASG